MAEHSDVRVQAGPRRCAFCHEEVPAEERVACAACFAAHHDACWGEAGRCATCQGTQALVREGQSIEAVAHPGRDPTAIAKALFPALGYTKVPGLSPGIAVFTRERTAMLSAVGEGFTDCWVVIGPDEEPATACAEALGWIHARSFRRVWHYLTREPVVNFVVLTDGPATGVPAPSSTRQFFSPLVYTVTVHSPKSGRTRTETTWTGSVSAQKTLAALRYALEQGVLPRDGEALGADLLPTMRLGSLQLVPFLLLLAVVLVVVTLVVLSTTVGR
jgi:hypothetical protein